MTILRLVNVVLNTSKIKWYFVTRLVKGRYIDYFDAVNNKVWIKSLWIYIISYKCAHGFVVACFHVVILWVSSDGVIHLTISLQWRQNGHESVSDHQPRGCLLNRYSGTDQRKHQSSASLAFVRVIHLSPVNSPHKGPVTRKNISISWRHRDVVISRFLWWRVIQLTIYFADASMAQGLPGLVSIPLD